MYYSNFEYLSTSPVFAQQNTFFNLGKMFMEQIIEFELRGPGLVVVLVLLSKLGIFKTKPPEANLRANYYLQLKRLLEAMYLIKFNPKKCTILNVLEL